MCKSNQKDFEIGDPLREARKAVMAVLAQASAEDLRAVMENIPKLPTYSVIRAPEVGLVMVRGRAGGVGQKFNLGEATVTRCAITLENGIAGFSYSLGRDKEKALNSAVIDALWQDEASHQLIEKSVIAPLRERQAEVRLRDCEQTAATRVDFFTMVRGDD